MKKQRRWCLKSCAHWLAYPVCSDKCNPTQFPAGLLSWPWCFWLDIKESHLQRLLFGLIPRAESNHGILKKKILLQVQGIHMQMRQWFNIAEFERTGKINKTVLWKCCYYPVEMKEIIVLGGRQKTWVIGLHVNVYSQREIMES